MTGIEKLRDRARSLRFVGFAWTEELADDLESIADQIESPEPKVPDADGAEIRKGDAVWHAEDGREGTVKQIVRAHDAQWNDTACVCVTFNGSSRDDYILPANLTHRAPVLAADGKPLLEGETVWDRDGNEYQVTEVKDGIVGAEYLSCVMRSHWDLKGSQLTHERPDSLKRLAEDMGKMAAAWRTQKSCYDAQEAAAQCVGEKTLGMALDSLALRAKALAERDA